MRRIRLDLSYDGTEFCGWQIQAAGRTVQGVLEEVLASFLKEKIRVTGSGRTDSGVHAESQTCHFDTENLSVPAEKFAPALNSFLPADIRIRKSAAVGNDFHARFSAKERIYRYRFFPGTVVPPVWRHCCWAVRHPMDIDRLNRLAALFVGTHDFSAFMTSGSSAKTFTRTIYSSSVSERDGRIIFRITGNGFLYNMVRIMAGALMRVGRGEKREEDIERALSTGDRRLMPDVAPPEALYLVSVEYDGI